MTPEEMVKEASKYDSVMDVGCGTGKYLRMLAAPTVIGIDAHLPTIAHAKSVCPTADLRLLDMRDLHVFKDDTVECIVAMDIIEHVIKDEAFLVLKEFERVASKCIFLFVPTGNHPQAGDATNLGNFYWQVHRSTWHSDEFKALGYEIWDYPSFFKNKEHSKSAVSCRKLLQK